MTKLKPCPFCGSERLVCGRDVVTQEICGILCLQCKAKVRFEIKMKGLETFGENEEKWAAAWNGRK